MQRCLALAQKGLGQVSPNPMVGAVIVREDRVIGEGYHEQFGGPHAEVKAIQSVTDQELLRDATLYVNLEPCNHMGKTPPCTEAILQTEISRVVIGMSDLNPLVAGQGIQRLQEAGIQVSTGIEEQKCLELNRRFIVNQKEHRPYIILKWAQTADGFIAREDYSSKWISAEPSRKLVHRWRSEEDAVLVGTRTAQIDDPELNVRLIDGRDPIRILLDERLEVPTEYNLYNGKQKTFLVSRTQPGQNSVEWIPWPESPKKSRTFWEQLLASLYSKNIGSIIVEGGSAILHSLIAHNLWDEARIFKSPENFLKGIPAPGILQNPSSSTEVPTTEDLLSVYFRCKSNHQ
ncbi:MAG: bifunctional diaminohydroxyphosphoribosylaminopyrimidine deaminase/5-amino-6-(5-phosphoribosylamino)uracil reductase RibD [Bdellovibrionales bacterium]|nr:bifunctional diaminohydroxyphosphoribosylaminopyrimidine deaminase/5-amino-6-(5-phosphoribosylamino)uracil reductase RibD [Bdellovibrionales bacterium]